MSRNVWAHQGIGNRTLVLMMMPFYELISARVFQGPCCSPDCGSCCVLCGCVCRPTGPPCLPAPSSAPSPPARPRGRPGAALAALAALRRRGPTRPAPPSPGRRRCSEASRCSCRAADGTASSSRKAAEATGVSSPLSFAPHHLHSGLPAILHANCYWCTPPRSSIQRIPLCYF